MGLNNIKKILIINLGGIGDLLLSLTALRALREKYREAVIDILVVSRTVELIKDTGFFNSIFVLSKKDKGFLSLLLQLRKNRYDVVVNMRTILSWFGALKLFFLFSFIDGRIKVGRDTEKMGFFFDIIIPESWPGEKYELEYDIAAVEALGAFVRDRHVTLGVNPEAAVSVRRLLEGLGVHPGDMVIGIHPGGMPSRRWPIENFSAVIKQVHERFACAFIITGSAEESSLGAQLASMQGLNIINLCGKLQLREFAALINRCTLFISNDTGPMHMAAALGVSLIAIFGPGCLARYDPRNISKRTEVFYKKEPCAPCNNFSCNSMHCLNSIQPQEVGEAALRLLQPSGIDE
jgi:heptosyltransferase-2